MNELVVADFLSEFGFGQTELKQCTCRRCGKPIESLSGEVWFHTDSARSRGCRSASFTREHGWDDSIDRRWTAAPKKRA